MSKKLPVRDFKWLDNLSMFTEEFITNYDENSDKGYILEVDVEYPKKLHSVHSDLPFLPERKLQRFPMEQIYLKCATMKCYQKINGVLIKSYY